MQIHATAMGDNCVLQTSNQSSTKCSNQKKLVTALSIKSNGVSEYHGGNAVAVIKKKKKINI